MSATSVKTRHYHALASRLRQLQTNLHDSEVQFDQLAHRLESMQKLGTYHAAQFMATSRGVHLELADLARRDALAQEQAEKNV